jgi:hypothetical protein
LSRHEALEAFLDDLESGRVKPKLVVGDEHLQELSPRLVRFVATHYVRGDHDIWIRNPES